MRVLVTDDSPLAKEIVAKLKETLQMDVASTSMYAQLGAIASSTGNHYDSEYFLRDMYDKQRCQEYFQNMSLKGITRNRNKKTNRLRVSILTKKRHKK